jgi:hypothetical protein
MSNLVMPNEGEGVCMAALLGKVAAATPLTLRLFSNNHTPANTDTSASYTEVSGGGYAAFALTAANWVVTNGSPTSAAYPVHSFAFTGVIGGSGNVYGYYITDANNKVIVAQLLNSPPFTPLVNGDQVLVTPTITLASVTGD